MLVLDLGSVLSEIFYAPATYQLMFRRVPRELEFLRFFCVFGVWICLDGDAFSDFWSKQRLRGTWAATSYGRFGYCFAAAASAGQTSLSLKDGGKLDVPKVVGCINPSCHVMCFLTFQSLMEHRALDLHTCACLLYVEERTSLRRCRTITLKRHSVRSTCWKSLWFLQALNTRHNVYSDSRLPNERSTWRNFIRSILKWPCCHRENLGYLFRDEKAAYCNLFNRFFGCSPGYRGFAWPIAMLFLCHWHGQHSFGFPFCIVRKGFSSPSPAFLW